jgi:beta-lactam-binding protein with PASTA domain
MNKLKNILKFFKSRAFLINLGIAIVALPLLFWLIMAWLSHYTRHNDFVTVPDFKDLKTEQLGTFVSDKNIGYEVIDSIWDPKLQKGIVIKQDPYAGEKVKEGRKIYLYVTASSPPKINMPDLTGESNHNALSERQAVRVCESYGLKYQTKGVNDPRKDLCVGQLYKGKPIAAGTLIEKGSLITICVGKGEGESSGDIAIPNLIGMNFRAARGKMIDLGLEWVLIPDAGVKDTLNATIYNQEPAPNRDRKILPGATIDLRVSNDKSKAKSDTI